MNTKKIRNACLFLALTVLIALGGFWQPAAAKSGIYRLVEGQTLGLGGQGLHVTNIPLGVTHAYLDNVGRNLPSGYRNKVNMKYRAPAMEVRFLDAEGGEVERISALVYVYFNISRAERDLWFKSGMEKISIWFVSQETGNWELCPTYFVHQSHGAKTLGRLACLAPGSGYYVLAQGDFSTYLLSSNMANRTNSKPITLKVRAYIDGRSQLNIQGDTLYWHHLDFAAPGRHYFSSEATYLNTVKWQPTWPDKPDAENRDCHCDSSSYVGVPTLARSNQSVSMYIIQGRGDVSILQQPDAENDYTLIIELDDNPLDGPTWYEIDLSYTNAPSG